MSENKKVFLVSNTAWSIFNFRKGVIKYLLSKQYDVFCAAPEDDYSEKLRKLGVKFIHLKIDAKGINPMHDIFYFFRLKKIYNEYKPDIIFHYTIKPNIYGAIAARILDIPCISVVTGAGIVFLKKSPIYFIGKFLYRIGAKCANEFWFINKEDQHFFLSEKIVAPYKTYLLPGEGVDTEFFKRKFPYEQLNNENFRFLFSSRLLWVKGINYYYKAAKRLQHIGKVEFLIIGFIDKDDKGSVKETEIQKWVDEKVILYKGAVSDVRHLLNEINCLVFPSYYKEGVPRVLLEAASMEIPIITTNNVGCRDVVDDKVNGLICDVQNEEDVFQAMKTILETDKEILVKMGKEGRKKVLSKFDEKYVIKTYKEAIGRYLAH